MRMKGSGKGKGFGKGDFRPPAELPVSHTRTDHFRKNLARDYMLEPKGAVMARKEERYIHWHRRDPRKDADREGRPTLAEDLKKYEAGGEGSKEHGKRVAKRQQELETELVERPKAIPALGFPEYMSPDEEFRKLFLRVNKAYGLELTPFEIKNFEAAFF